VVSNLDIDSPVSLDSLLQIAASFISSKAEISSDASKYRRMGYTLQAGRTSEGRPLDDSGASDIERFAALVCKGVTPMSPSVIASKDDLFASDASRAANVHHAMRRACVNRRLFVTKDRRLGLGPRTMEEGDVIGILSGSLWPVVLRECCESRYRVVGVCYLECAMFGEALTKERKTTSFTII
jgi:hypothetical protein